MSRDCLLCGAMICGCEWHTARDSLQTYYGICESCTEDITTRVGEGKKVLPDETIRHTTSADYRVMMRVKAYLDSLQKERAS